MRTREASELQYELVEGWERLPEGYGYADVAGLGIDSQDRVYALTRRDARVIVYEADGSFVKSLAEGLFTERTHGLAIGPDGSIFCVDDGDHTVRKFTPDGELVMTIGTSGVPSQTGYDGGKPSLYEKLKSITQGGPPFNRPTNLAVAANGDLYVADGYGNARVHRFSADGELIQSWGEPGTARGQFNLPHAVWVTPDNRVLVADRENDRVQVFTLEGKFLGQWTEVQRPTDLTMDHEGRVYVAELPWLEGHQSFVRGAPDTDLPGRVSVLDGQTGDVIIRLGGTDEVIAAHLRAPHAIALDSRGDLYVGHVLYSLFGGGDGPASAHGETLTKLARTKAS